MKENRRPILRPKIRSLPVRLRRVVHVPEPFHQRLVTHLLGIERHLHHFRVPRRVRAHFLVRRVLFLSSAVPHNRLFNSRNHPELRLHSPKTSRRKRRNLTHFPLPRFILPTKLKSS